MSRPGLILLFLWLAGNVAGQDSRMYEKHWLINDGDTLPYRLLLPEQYDPGKKYPLLIFLHGSGERGTDNEKQLVHGADLFTRDSIRKNYPAIVVFPQCPVSSSWSNAKFLYDSSKRRTGFIFSAEDPPTLAMKLLLELLHELSDNYSLDKNRFYVGGLSMGGMGTFELVARKPKIFAAAFPVCGGGDTLSGKKLKKTCWWIFHGLKDDVVPPQLSISMADAIRRHHGRVRLSLYPEANHNSWDAAFAEKELLHWLFAQHK
ncbi:MAG TPA: prolyl oligopeptidase family serine peptidase [Chitinophagaceae bacterium]